VFFVDFLEAAPAMGVASFFVHTEKNIMLDYLLF
jgi:hypothetical protein